MSESLILGIMTILGSILATLVTYKITTEVNRKKVPAEVKQINANTDLSTGELADKYLGIANRTADENIELAKELKIREENHLAERTEFINEIKGLKQDVKDLTVRIEQAEKENEQWKDYIQRLIYQLKSWDVVPVPLSVREAKEKGLPLGEFGNYKQDGTIK